MKKTIIAAAIGASALLAALPALATGPAGNSGVSSNSQIVLSAGVNGGKTVGGVLNRQSTDVDPSTNLGGATTILGQSIGAASVSGAGKTSSMTMGAVSSQGNAGGEILGGGSSQITQSQQNQYATSNGVSGQVAGSMTLNSGSTLNAADNGGGVIGGTANASYLSTADSSKTGLFSATRTANSSVGGVSQTSQPTTLTWGNSAYGLTNNSTISGSAGSKSGTLVSNP